MRHAVKYLIPLLFLVCLAGACTKEQPAVEPMSGQEASQAKAREILGIITSAISGSNWLSGVSFHDGGAVITFQDGSSVDVPSGIFQIYKEEPVVVTDASTEWKVNGVLTGIKKRFNTFDAGKFPICGWYDGALVLYLDTGEKVVLGSGPDGEIPHREIPRLLITTDGKAAIRSKTEYVSGTIRLEDPDQVYSDVQVYEGRMRIRGRGNSTWSLQKKPYKIKLDDKAKMLGMPSNRDWVLLANHFDKTLMRNTVALRLSEICSLPWTPQSRVVEAYLNGDYIGSYDLVQHKEVAGKKVNINLAAGDCYLELDETLDGPVGFKTPVYSVPVLFKDPELPDEGIKNMVVSRFREAEEALAGENFKDPANGWRSFIDEESLINYYIVQELSKNIDGNLRRSTYLTLGPEKKICFCHIWDFDLAFGNSSRISLEFPGATNTYEGWYIKEFGRLGKGKGWFPRLFEDPAFVSSLKERWGQVYPALQQVPDFIDARVAAANAAYSHNFERWQIIGSRLGPNVEVFRTYDGEVDYLKNFYSSRLAWLDRNIGKL